MQRCDTTVGGASWRDVRVSNVDLTSGVELTSLVVTVRDAATDAALATREMVDTGGSIDLSAIDPVAHPAVYLDATAVSVSGSPAWADVNPPRLELRWFSDSASACFRTTTVVNCDAPSTQQIGVDAVIAETASAALRLVKPCQCDVYAERRVLRVGQLHVQGQRREPRFERRDGRHHITKVALSRALAVNVVGSGSVGSSPAGIACPTTCAANFTDGAFVGLTATPASGFAFTGWSVACTGAGACSVAIVVDNGKNTGSPDCQWSVSSARWWPVVLPGGGQQNCPVVASSAARDHWARGLTPLPVVAWVRRMLSPAVSTTCA